MMDRQQQFNKNNSTKFNRFGQHKINSLNNSGYGCVIRRKSIDRVQYYDTEAKTLHSVLQNYATRLKNSIDSVTGSFTSWTSDLKSQMCGDKITRAEMINVIQEDPILWKLFREEMVISGFVTNIGVDVTIENFLNVHKTVIVNTMRHSRKAKSRGTLQENPIQGFNVLPAIKRLIDGPESSQQRGSKGRGQESPLSSHGRAVHSDNDGLLVSWPKNHKRNNAIAA